MQDSNKNYQFFDCRQTQEMLSQITHIGRLPQSAHMGILFDEQYAYWRPQLERSYRLAQIAERRAYKVMMASLGGIALFLCAFYIVQVIDHVQILQTQRRGFLTLPDLLISSKALWGIAAILAAMLGRFVQHQSAQKNIGNLAPKKAINIAQYFHADVKNILYKSYELAYQLNHAEVTPLHILAILPKTDVVATVFARLGLSQQALNDKLSTELAKQQRLAAQQVPQVGAATYHMVLLSFMLAQQGAREQVSAIDLIEAMTTLRFNTEVQEQIYDLFDQLDVNEQMLLNVVQWMRIKQQLRERYERFHSLARFKPKGGVNRAMTSIATKNLDMFSEDLTRAAAFDYLTPLIGRKKEVQEIFRVIEATNKSILLVGNRGIGRSAIIEGIAQLMVTEDVPAILQDKRMVRVSLPHLIGGVDPAQAQARLLQVTGEAIQSGNIVMGIQNLEYMIGVSTGSQSSLDLSQVLVNLLKNRRIFAIATTDPQSYAKYIEHSGINDAFAVIKIDEMPEDEAIQVLESKVAYIEAQHRVYFSYAALDAAVRHSVRYIHDQFLPAKAIDLIEQAAVYVRNNKKEGLAMVMAEDVANIIAQRTNIPVTSLTADESSKLLKLEELIHERIIGQEEAVSVVAASVRRGRTALRDERRPIANLLFLGPTGVGKTELSKTLADIYFGSEETMLRFDMSEFQEQSSVQRLLGTQSTPGLLTNAVRQNPFSLLLFDEIEKAHPDILNIFLQMMDDGRLTDGMGYTADFSNTIIIATSNAGTSFIQQEIQAQTPLETIKERLMREELRQYYRPEFLNRFDNIVVFKPLELAEIEQIARLLLKKVGRRLEDKNIGFEFTDEAVRYLAEAGFDPQFGARPMRRAIQERIDNQLAEMLLRGELQKRDIVVLEDQGTLRVQKN